MYEITQEQLNQISTVVAEIPTKYGIQLVNILNGLKKVEVKKEKSKE